MAIHTTGNSVSLTAQEHRNQTAVTLPPFKTALGVRGGTHSGLAITKTSGMGFSISAGRCVVEPAAPASGPYVVTVDAAVNMSFEPGDSARDRIDIVAIKVDETAGVDNPASVVIIKGGYPSTGSAVPPTVPKAHETLWQVPIPAGMSAGSGGWVLKNAKDLRVQLVGNGSAIPVASLSERGTLLAYEGMQVMRMDLDGTIDRFVDGTWRGNTAWVNVTMSPNYRHVPGGSGFRVKLTADGNLGMLSGEITLVGNSVPREGDVLGTIPASAMAAGILPEQNSWVIGTDEGYRNTMVLRLDENGRIALGPYPNGRTFMFQGTFPVKPS